MSSHDRATQDRLEALQFRLRVFDPYLVDPNVNEIAVNRLCEVWLLRGPTWHREMVPCLTFTMLETIGANLANYVSKLFDREHTSLSAYLPTGERIEMTHAPTAPEGIFFLNIRKHVTEAFPHSELAQRGYYRTTKHEKSLGLTAERRAFLADYLNEHEIALYDLAQRGEWEKFMIMAVAEHQNIVISGATGSGKTTYLRSLIDLIDPTERLITIEDTPEMPLWNPERPEKGHPNNNSLIFQQNGSAEGDIIENVVRCCMRKTPHRVILCEMRGPEAMYYLSGVLGAGHDGGMTTVHAGDPREAFNRIAFLIKSSPTGQGIEMPMVINFLYSIIHIVVQLKFDAIHGRRVTAIYYDPMKRLSLFD